MCDGAGSTHFGGFGANIVCRTVTESARTHFLKQPELPSDDVLWSWIDEARDRINQSALSRNIERREFSSTLVTVVATSTATLIFHIGDGAAVTQINGTWEAASWPAHGEYASQTFFVTEDPAPQLRITRLEAAISGVALFSDGIERLVLDFVNQTAPAPFFDTMMKPLASSAIVGRDQKLCASLKRYLDGERINERTDDDKSLILALRR